MAERVRDHVRERLLEPRSVGLHAQPRGALQRTARPRGAGGGREPADHRVEHLPHLEPLALQRQPPLLGARDHEQIVGELGQPLDLLGRRANARVELAVGALAAERQLELQLEDRQRRAQLVACVGDQRPLAGERVLEPAEHRVDGVAETMQLIVGLRHGQPLTVRSARDPRRLRTHLLHRRQRAGGQDVARHARQDEQHRAADEQQVAERGQRAVALRQRRADDEHGRRPRGDRAGQHARARRPRRRGLNPAPPAGSASG